MYRMPRRRSNLRKFLNAFTFTIAAILAFCAASAAIIVGLAWFNYYVIGLDSANGTGVAVVTYGLLLVGTLVGIFATEFD